MPIFQRPVSLILFVIIVWTIVSQLPWYKRKAAALKAALARKLTPGRQPKT